MPAPDPSHKLDHVVVLMFENRSFDNLLGYLYQPGEVPQFEGVAGRDLSNPLPDEIPGPDRSVAVHPSRNRGTPDPDPGEEFPHVSTQLYGTVDPPANRTREVDDMASPFNAPPAGAGLPPMTGFVADFANAFHVEMGRWPTADEVGEIMACYRPEDLPVLSTLAREFAVFDHWFCEVPTQTYANRSFFHAASSSGLVLNAPVGSFESKNDAPTIFERLEDAGRSWRVYYDPAQFVSATALIHARRLMPRFADRFRSIFEFYDDARDGTLPDYAFLEPNMFHPHTDLHPHGFGKIRWELGIRHPDCLTGGEQLLADVYNAVRNGASETGSNWSNTLLLVTFDEHGGTYDHVPPPNAPPPDPAGPAGQMGFRFDRSGVRIPTIAISAWVDRRTVISEEFRSTSMIRTLRERWNLGPPLTARDAVAADIAPVLRRATARPPSDWPSVAPIQPTLAAEIVEKLEGLDAPMGRLERDLAGEAMAHESRSRGEPFELDLAALSHREVHAHLGRLGPVYFPRVASALSRR